MVKPKKHLFRIYENGREVENELLGTLFAIFVTIGIPIIGLIYAIIKKHWLPFLLGVLAFTISQLFLRIPLLNFLQDNVSSYVEFQMTNPILFAIILAFSASLFENTFRYIFMRFFMNTRKWLSGFLFGLGHGGIEAIALVGIQAVLVLFTPGGPYMFGELYGMGGLERLLAMTFHIGLSIIILRSVVEKRFVYFFLAFLLHGFTDTLVGILPIYMDPSLALITLEASLAIIAFGTLFYSIYMKRKGILS